MSIPRIATRRPIAVVMLMLGAVLVGILAVIRMPVDLLPDVAYPKLVVYTAHNNAAPSEIERLVTEPIEQAVSTVLGVQRVESVTREGASLVTARFAWGTNMDFAALGVREKLDGLRGVLPERSSRPTVLRTDPRSSPILALSLAGPEDLADLTEIAESVLRRRLEQIDGLAEVAIAGGGGPRDPRRSRSAASGRPQPLDG
jgi:HAE1 family hydrophobic/amphiphilic exporter-1